MVEGMEVLALRYDVDTGAEGFVRLSAFFEQVFAECGSLGPLESVSLLFADRHSVADMLEESAIDGGQSPHEFVQEFVYVSQNLHRLPRSDASELCH